MAFSAISEARKSKTRIVYYGSGKHRFFFFTITGGAYVISNQNPRCTQKPTYAPIFTHRIRSSILCTPQYYLSPFFFFSVSRGGKNQQKLSELWPVPGDLSPLRELRVI